MPGTWARSCGRTYEAPQLQLDEPQLALFLGGSPQAQLGWEQSVLEVVHLTLDDYDAGQDGGWNGGMD